MYTLLNKTNIFSFLTLGFCISLSGHAADSSQIAIKKFRYHNHSGLNFERLVLEFANKGGAGNAMVKMAPSANGKETLIGIDKVVLVGAIPEATINDAYSKESRYFGPIAINNDNPRAGFTIRTSIKNPNAMVDAFWLQNPSRLILDVYPRNSPRAQGPDILSHMASRSVASHKGNGKPSGKKSVVCYFANSQVLASLGFEEGHHPRGLAMTVDDAGAMRAEGQVVCYPSSAQAQPRVIFNMKNAPPPQKVSMGFEPYQSSLMPFAPAAPVAPPPQQFSAAPMAPIAPSRPMTRDDQLNRDADLAFGGDDDSRGLSSPGLFSGVDNFNKNNPPPTLGKALTAPSAGGNRPQFGSPAGGSLLPPLR